nr:immunoglobulin light chain junction region [Macaca mulatta]MOY05063.1 immunoglobulin light chain junction region [Macaca mulatta]MOY05158.1 immunoglobulin light chain junction region [Macaca mulatta]MOY05159.1 immunoglobulin light chain junction region [Macaca mulatta]MOY05436.1 immunoglobulin light chain junction region [Macaca mulatta]
DYYCSSYAVSNTFIF